MNRELKFRAWSKKYNAMYPVRAIHFDTKLTVIELNEKGITSLVDDKLDGIVHMQYTGFKDKNGVEIYQGDILRTTSILASDKIDDKYFNVLVRWSGSSFIANGILNKYQSSISTVIGNIYENKELLKETQ